MGETRTGTKSEVGHLMEPKCPVCGAAAVGIDDPILGEITQVLRCGCFGKGSVRLDATKPKPEPKTCADCGAACEVRFLDALGRWFQASTCKCEEDRKRRLETEEAEREREVQAAGRFQRAQIPERFASATLENFEPVEGTGKALQAIQAYVERLEENLRAGRALWIVGPVGSGKTHLALGLLRRAVAQGWTGRFLPCRTYMRDLKASYGGESESPLREATACSVLLLDDIGSMRLDRNPEHVREALLDLLDERYLAVRPTFVTSNLTAKELAEALDERITSRLTEMCERVTLKAADYRKRKVER